MFDADCLVILLTALELHMFEERRLEAGQLMREQGVRRSLLGETEVSFRSRSGSRTGTQRSAYTLPDGF